MGKRYKEGEEVWVNMSGIERSRRKEIWKRGKIKREYRWWYLVDFGKYLSGANGMDIRRRRDGE